MCRLVKLDDSLTTPLEALDRGRALEQLGGYVHAAGHLRWGHTWRQRHNRVSVRNKEATRALHKKQRSVQTSHLAHVVPVRAGDAPR